MKKEKILLTFLSFTLIIFLQSTIAQDQFNLNYDSTKNSINISYDENDRINLQTGLNDWIKYFYDFDKNGTITNISNNNGVVIRYKYDDKKRIFKEIKEIDSQVFIKEISYDSLDRITSEILSDRSSMNYTYNNQSNLRMILDILNISYNEQDQIVAREYNNDLQTNYIYNTSNFRLKNITTRDKQSINYSYDLVGNVIEINDVINKRYFSMIYDSIDRLIGTLIINHTIFKDNNISFLYNEIGNILNISLTEENITFDYEILPHIPFKMFSYRSPQSIFNFSLLNTSSLNTVFEFGILDDNFVSSSFPLNFNFGDGNSFSNSTSFSLDDGEDIFVIIEHNYTSGGILILSANVTIGEFYDIEYLEVTI